MSERGPNGHFAKGNTTGLASGFKPGQTGNPGGVPKTKKELRELAREGLPKAFARAMEILNDDDAEWRAWLEAGKFLGAHSYIAPAKPEKEEDAGKTDRNALSVEERRAIARMRLSTEKAADAVPEPASDTEH